MKHRYVLLDGMRGIACFAVLLLHIQLLFKVGIDLPHANLAVDFFFILSGFVIANAYEKKIENGLSPYSFMKKRLTKLYPMIFIGACMGSFHLIIHGLHKGLPIENIFANVIGSFLVLPSPLPLNDSMFAANQPEWSLFFEFFINAVYAVFLPYLSIRRLGYIVFISGLAFLLIGLINGNLGFGFLPETFLYGFVRVTFGFFLGVLLWRKKPTFNINYTSCFPVILLCGALFIPIFGGSVIYEFVLISVAFPIIIIWAAQFKVGGVTEIIYRKLGELSYPLYATHFPVLTGLKKISLFMPEIHPAFTVVICCLIATISAGLFIKLTNLNLIHRRKQ